MAAIKPGDWCEDAISKQTVLAVAEGYVMVRRPRAIPFVLCDTEWLSRCGTPEKNNEAEVSDE